MFNSIEAKFAQSYINIADFCNSYTSLIKQEKDSIRIDRVLQFSLRTPIAGKTLTMGYMYKYNNEPSTNYINKYKIDCKVKGNRVLWMHKVFNESNKTLLSYSENVLSVCEGDIFEISVNYFTLRGLIDINSISCIEPILEKTPELKSINRKSYNLSVSSQIDLMENNIERICEV